MDIGIVGAGFAGLSAATLLARGGHRVTVYERAPNPGPVGAAIVLQPSGLSVLKSLELASETERLGIRLDRLHVTNPRGRTLVDLAYGDLDPRWYGLGIGRGELFSVLWQAAVAAGVSMRPGIEMAASAPRPEGRFLIDPEGREHGPHELVIAADGARSKVAPAIPGRKVTRYPWGALFFVGAQPDSSILRQVAAGTRRFLGVLPMGQGQASLFWSVREDRVDAWRRGFSRWRDEALALGPFAAPLIEAIPSPDAMLFAPYHDVRMKRWHDGNLIAIGDAAHATSPQLGQGTNLALWDAFVLRDCLDLDLPLEARLTRYGALRKRHLRYFQRATRWLTPFFQGDSRVLGWVRDLALPLGLKLPPIRRLMTASMAGNAAGFFGAREPLPVAWPD
jgi:2-polyprenyl-6-methoxyphenol hydroxylase-like FAD-dependent oxidoreductase